MSDGIDLLDVSALQPELDPFRSAHDESVIGQARRLLTLLLMWDRLSSEPSSPDEWAATRVTLDSGERTITCRNEAAAITLIGNWSAQTLESVIVEVADRYWASRETKHGESRLSHDPCVEGPADRRPFADLERRSREEMERWTKEHPPKRRWACANCHWQNEPEDATCRVCDLPASIREASPGRRPSIDEASPVPDEAPRSEVMTLPPGMEDILRALIPVAAAAPSTPRFELVLLGFVPENRGAIVELLGRTLHASPGDIESLISTVPAHLVGGLSVTKARDLSEKLETLGASIEIRKNRA